MVVVGPAVVRTTIRDASVADAVAIAALAGELGYEVTPAEALERLRSLPDGDEVFVVETDGRVVAWMHLREYRTLLLEPQAEVLGIVVTAACRGRGIGRRLIAHAEAWARARGLARVYLRSGSQREAAHRFYLGLGFEHAKTSLVFRKPLA